MPENEIVNNAIEEVVEVAQEESTPVGLIIGVTLAAVTAIGTGIYFLVKKIKSGKKPEAVVLETETEPAETEN